MDCMSHILNRLAMMRLATFSLVIVRLPSASLSAIRKAVLAIKTLPLVIVFVAYSKSLSKRSKAAEFA